MWWEKAKTRFESLMIRSTFVIQSHKIFPKAALVVGCGLTKGVRAHLGLATCLPLWWWWHGRSNVASIPLLDHADPAKSYAFLLSTVIFLLARHPSTGSALKPHEGETKVCVCPRRLSTLQSSAHPPLHFDPVFRGGKMAFIEAALCFNGPTCCCDCRTWTVIWMLSGNLVMAHCNSHCTHSSESFFFSCLSGTFECCS